MTERGLAAVALAAALALPASADAASHFADGVASAEITSSSARLWTRADHAGPATLRVGGRTFALQATDADDLTVQRVVSGLRPGTAYRYAFAQDGSRSQTGRFRTAPAPARNATVRFAWSGDADAAFNDFAVYDRMAREHNAFTINLGDTIYSDSEAPGAGPSALTVADKWARYRANLAVANLRKVRAAGGMYNHWDDHEFVNDYTRAGQGDAIYDAGVKAFRDYMPVTYSASAGIYRSFRWGHNLQLFFLDERSFRSAKASDGNVCDNPDTGAPDIAPALPQRVRDFFGRVKASFKQPIAPACLAAIDDPSRSMLGAAQLARFESAIGRSRATWKVIVNEVPIQQFYALPYDRWEGYAAERTKLLQFLAHNVRNAVFLTTDVHANLVGSVRYSTLEDTGASNTGMTEFTTGPVATRTFATEVDEAFGRTGVADLVSGAFLKPAPPNGIGMRCAAIDTDSYGEVTVSAKRLRVALKDARGRTVKESDGRACGPYVLKAH